MRNVLCVFGCLLMLAVLSGCDGKHQTQKGNESAVDTGSRFPEFLAGTWKAEESPWRVVLTPDGRVAEAYVMWGELMRPNRTTEFMMQNGMGHITAGDFFVEYTPVSRELFVRIDLKDIHILFPGGVLDGNSIDYIRGPVSEDGKTWNAEWITIYDYGPDFPQDLNDVVLGQLVFRKVQPQAAVADSNENH